MWFFLLIWSLAPQNNATKVFNYDGLEKLTATFGLIVVTVVGYYFGQRQSDEISQRVEKTAIEAGKAKSEAIENKMIFEQELWDSIKYMEEEVEAYNTGKKMGELLTSLSDNEKKIFRAKVPEVNINQFTRTFDEMIKKVTAKREEKKEILTKMIK